MKYKVVFLNSLSEETRVSIFFHSVCLFMPEKNETQKAINIKRGRAQRLPYKIHLCPPSAMYLISCSFLLSKYLGPREAFPEPPGQQLVTEQHSPQCN